MLVAEEASVQAMSALTPGRYFVELIPALRYVPEWFPGAGKFQKAARLGREIGHRMVSVPFNDVKQSMVRLDLGCVFVLF